MGLTPKDANFVIEYCKDFASRRAAEASGYAADSGYKLLEKPEIAKAVERVVLSRLESSHIDAEWVLMEAVDNHMIARQAGNITASNTALNMVAKHMFVDAYAAEKVEVNSDKEIIERLRRGRSRANLSDDTNDDVSFF
jgi:phage terminase small subunit